MDLERLRALAKPFLSFSYPIDTPQHVDSFPHASYYDTGRWDACLVITLILVMAILRDFIRVSVLEPFARWKLTKDFHSKNSKKAANGVPNGHSNGHANGHANGHISKKDQRTIHRSVLRFAEQGYSFFCYVCCWSYGYYVHRNLPTKLLNPEHVWIGYPHIPLPGPVKFYYLLQTANYLHQILILNAEARRKDHFQMMSHHIVTVVLLVLSYFYNFTRIGCIILFIMDFCDILLPLAKMLKYLGFNFVCDLTFVLFLVSWFLTRHVIYNLVVLSMYTDLPRHLSFDWIPEKGHFLTNGVWNGFVSLLVALQIMQIVWFWMICRVAYRVVTGGGAEDTRSDESDGEDMKDS